MGSPQGSSSTRVAHKAMVVGSALASAVTVLMWASFWSDQADAANNTYPNQTYGPICADGNFGSTFCKQDNRAVSVFFQQSVNSTVESTVRTRLTDMDNSTVLNVSYPGTATYDGNTETDIIYQVDTSGFSNSTIGQTWCNDAAGPDQYTCDQHYVRFKSAADVDKELACHETGHAVALTHGRDAYPPESQTATELQCMETPDSGAHLTLGQHNKDEINAKY